MSGFLWNHDQDERPFQNARVKQQMKENLLVDGTDYTTQPGSTQLHVMTPGSRQPPSFHDPKTLTSPICLFLNAWLKKAPDSEIMSFGAVQSYIGGWTLSCRTAVRDAFRCCWLRAMNPRMQKLIALPLRAKCRQRRPIPIACLPHKQGFIEV